MRRTRKKVRYMRRTCKKVRYMRCTCKKVRYMRRTKVFRFGLIQSGIHNCIKMFPYNGKR